MAILKATTRKSLNFTVVTLGSVDAEESWLSHPEVTRVVNFRHASPMGTRFGKRALGLGIDALIVAVKAVTLRRKTEYLATNPWIALVLRMLTFQPVSVTGLYSVPGQLHWSLFSLLLRKSRVVTQSTIESENWNAEGRQAISVLYGNQFDYPQRTTESLRKQFRIFIGGSSDRNHSLIDSIEAEVLSSGRNIDLTIATGGKPQTQQMGVSKSTRLGVVSQHVFGQYLADADCVLLPLTPSARSAGHMILVGALQTGTPVVVTGGDGMDGYIDGTFVHELTEEELTLKRLESIVESGPTRLETVQFWEHKFSRFAYQRRVIDALKGSNLQKNVARIHAPTD